MPEKKIDAKKYKFHPETREDWKTCPYCGGTQLAEVFMGRNWPDKKDRWHLCLKCRNAIYNRLYWIETVLAGVRGN